MTHSGGATIADGARFDGTYKGGDLTVLGRFDGALELRGRLQLGPQARVTGKVKAAAVEIEGAFDGELRADALAFGATSRAKGVFLAPRLSMREGARVDGALNVEPAQGVAAPGPSTDAKPKAAKPKDAPPPAAAGDDAALDAAGDTSADDAPTAPTGAGEAAAMSA